MSTEGYDALRERAWREAIDCFGTAAIFERRVRHLTWKTRGLEFIALGVPVLLGGAALAVWPLPRWAIVTGSTILVCQLAVALWASVSNWAQQLNTASESAAANTHLSIRFKRLGETPPPTSQELASQLSLLEAENDQRVRSDTKERVTPKEKRRGHRAALRQFRKPCSKCGEVPYSTKPTDCPVCGEF